MASLDAHPMYSKTAVVIVTDAGFLLPSVVLATSIAAEPRYRSLCDVLVYVLDHSEDQLDALRHEFGQDGLVFHGIRSTDLALPTASTNFGGHVPVAALARLTISDFVPDRYEDIVYLDGDTSVVGDIAPLLSARLPVGAVAAAAENFIMLDGSADFPPWLSTTLSEVGLSRPRDYFNSGVMAFRADTWRSVGREAMAFYVANEARCRHHDQSALNAVLSGKWLRLGLSYNFQSFFVPIVAADQIPRRLLHFSSSPKPWASPDSYWGADVGAPYRKLSRLHPGLFSTAVGTDAEFARRKMPWVRDLKRRVKYLMAHGEKGRNLRAYLRDESFFLE